MGKAVRGAILRVAGGWTSNPPLVSGQQIATPGMNNNCYVKPTYPRYMCKGFPFPKGGLLANTRVWPLESDKHEAKDCLLQWGLLSSTACEHLIVITACEPKPLLLPCSCMKLQENIPMCMEHRGSRKWTSFTSR